VLDDRLTLSWMDSRVIELWNECVTINVMEPIHNNKWTEFESSNARCTSLKLFITCIHYCCSYW
jgi:hypothetical protein